MANKTTIGVAKNGQFLTTFPKAIGEAIGLKKGDHIEWLFHQGDIIVRKQ